MPRFFPSPSFLLAFFAAVAVASCAARTAVAQSPPKPVLAVDIAPGEPELNPTTLRAAIGAEIGDEAVAPDDPRAPNAVGTVSVSVERAAHALIVAYRGANEPIMRRVDLPPDPAAIERTAVMLAGNLARDEGDELAQSLRKPKPTPEGGDRATDGANEASRDFDRLGAALVSADGASRSKRAWSVALEVTGGVAISGGLIIGSFSASSSGHTDVPLLVGGEAIFVAGGALTAFSAALRPGDYSGLIDRYQSWREYPKPADARADLEQLWRESARREHRRRAIAGTLVFVSSGIALTGGVGVLCLAAVSPSRFGTPATGEAIGLLAFGAAVAPFGVYMMKTDGDMASALHDYERAPDAMPAQRGARLSLQPIVAPTAGGAFAGLSGEF